jgi:hypothetical protein
VRVGSENVRRLGRAVFDGSDPDAPNRSEAYFREGWSRLSETTLRDTLRAKE